MDIDKFLKLDLSYPGISFGYESWALDTFLSVMEQQVSFAQDQYKLRAQRELERDAHRLEPEEQMERERLMEEVVEAVIPRFFRIAGLVPIWGLFESFISDFAAYVGRREKAALSFRDIRAQNFREQAEKYFEGVLKIPLPWSPIERLQLQQLQDLRNVIAHRNGRLSDLGKDKRREIETLVKGMPGVEIKNGDIHVSPEYLGEAAALVSMVLSNLNQVISKRYDGPIIEEKTET